MTNEEGVVDGVIVGVDVARSDTVGKLVDGKTVLKDDVGKLEGAKLDATEVVVETIVVLFESVGQFGCTRESIPKTRSRHTLC